jgi:hypothetical protein
MSEIGKFAIINGRDVYYVLAQDLINYLSDFSKIRNRVMISERILDSDVILIDELDKAYIKADSNYVQTVLENFLRKTVPQHKIIIIASNWKEEDIFEVLGAPAYSFINRQIKIINFKGKDISHSLQDTWMDRLTKESKFLEEENIVRCADLFQKRRKERLDEEFDISI